MTYISLIKNFNSKEPQHCLHHIVLSKMKPKVQIDELFWVKIFLFNFFLVREFIYVFLVSPLQEWKIINSYSNHTIFFTLCEWRFLRAAHKLMCLLTVEILPK